jgi:protein-arginine kinase
MKSEMDKLEAMQIHMRRNFRSMPFTPLMTKEAKLQVERKVVEVLGELYGYYRQVPKLNPEDVVWLKTLGIEVSRTKVHDAAGINDDFPVGRGVFIDDNKEFVVLINFEDHIHIVMLPITNAQGVKDYKSCFERLVKLNFAFERIGFANDPYLGSLTVSPKHLGTGLMIKADYKIKSSKCRTLGIEEAEQIGKEHNCDLWA